jgi:two-component system phosphate regulon response regulator PhoB
MGAPWRVLVVDDDPAICVLIKTILKNGPFNVTICNDAETALVYLQRPEGFDVIISDFMLPGISGIQLIEQIRSKPAAKQTPIVMISGHNNYAMDVRAKEAGADAFLRKPFTLSQLRLTISSLLPSQASGG